MRRIFDKKIAIPFILNYPDGIELVYYFDYAYSFTKGIKMLEKVTHTCRR